MDKRDRAEIFRNRLRQAMDHSGTNQTALARETGVDRSTWSQALQDGETRLPGAQQVAEAATALSVSADWLLGLTDRPERPGDLVAAAVHVADAERASV
ncbi:MAG: helix-turn-helix transcriptional regulator, partial [Pseudomonadota bacterium]